jgi:hypothetical protein
VTVLILPNLFMDSAQVIRDGLPYDIFRRFKGFIVPTIIGVFLGTMVLVETPLWVLNLGLGVMVLVFVLSNLLRLDFTVSPQQENFFCPSSAFSAVF